MTIAELKPLDIQNQKSFYNKAQIYISSDGTKVLKSYNTFVATLKNNGELIRHWNGYSQTTAKHLTAFLGRKIKKSDWLKLEIQSFDIIKHMLIHK